MAFWLTIIALAGIIAITLLVTMLRGRAGAVSPAAYDLQVYRDQLKEVEKDLARGIISEDDAGRTRVEISRKILESDKALKQGHDATRAPKAVTWAAGAVAVALVLGGSLALYDRMGAPGYTDLPIEQRKQAAEQARKTRPNQAAAEAQAPGATGLPAPDPKHVELVKKLREVVAQRPNDIQGLTLLARNEAALGNYKAAYEAQSKLIDLKQGDASADDYANLADMMVLAANGYVSPEAEAAVDKALNLDRTNGPARFYLGLLYAQTGRPDIAFNAWRGLLEDSKPDDPWVPPIRGGIEELAARAGVDYRLPPAAGAPGPSAADMQAAGQMSPEERQQMIRGMVGKLADRLDSEGGSAAEWARLIGSYGVLGEADKAQAALDKASEIFADSPEDLATVRAAANGNGAAPAPALRGPSQADVQAAGDMTPEQRMQMVRGMVARLSDRLANEGGSAAEWAQLINALGVLGETGQAKAIWGEAQDKFAQSPDDLATVRAAAEQAGLMD